MRRLVLLAAACCAVAHADDLKLIPRPQEIERLEGAFDWTAGPRVTLAVPHRAEDRFCASLLQEELAASVRVGERRAGADGPSVFLGRLSDPLIAGTIRDVDASVLADKGAEAYLLLVTPEWIVAAGNDDPGTFYAVQTLRQLIRAGSPGGRTPCVIVRDWPGLRYRGYSDDISRGPIPTMDFLKRQIRTMAELKMNMLTLYTEHVFKLEGHPVIAPPDGLSADEVRELSAYAKQYHVELVGNFQSFGHAWNILRHEQYHHLRETPSILTPAKEETYEFLDEVYSEVCPAYDSPLFNVNCDETYGLGEGPSKALAERIGVGGVYVRHMNRVHALLEKYGKRMMMWGDIALQHPEIVQQLERDTILLSWGYGAAESYDRAIEPFVQAGFEFMVCPGVSCWSRIFPLYDNAVVNIQNYVRDGARHGALGMLNTTWDDDGENLFTWNFYGTSWGAACAWRPPDADLEGYNAAFSQLMYGTPDDKVVRAIELLTACRRNPLTRGNSNAGFWVRPFNALATTFEAVDAQSAELCETTQEAIGLLEAAREEARFHAGDLDYLLLAARRLHYIGRARQLQLHCAYQYSSAAAAFPEAREAGPALETAVAAAEELVTRVEDLREDYERLWLAENRPWWLDRNLAKYDALLGDLRAQHERLKAGREELARTGVPPDPAALRLALVETSRRNVYAAPAGEDILPAGTTWWDERWPYRMALRVEAGEAALTDYPVEARVAFGERKVDPRSLRVVEHTGGGVPRPLLTQFDPLGEHAGNVAFIMPGVTAAGAARVFGLYYDLEGGGEKPAQDETMGVRFRREGQWVWVDNEHLRALVGPHGAHIFEWQVRALNDLQITHPGRHGWAGFADTGRDDRDASFTLVAETPGPVMVRIRATSEAAGSEKVFQFYAGKPLVEVMLSSAVGFYWDYDNVDNFAADRGNPGTALFSNGHTAPVCRSDEQVHAIARGVTWGAKMREDGLLLANITPEVEAEHRVGPGGGWGGVGIEHSAPASHFITLADRITDGDPAAALNAVQQTLDLRNQPKMWVGRVEGR